MARVLDAAIAALARKQHGYVTREQLLELGLGVGAIKFRIGAGQLIAVYSGVYAVGHLPSLPIDRAAAAVLACGPTAALSHGSAVSLWGWDTKYWRLPFEVTSRVEDDRDRDRDVEHLVVGLETVRITWERLIEEPDREARRLHAILARRRREAA